MKTLSQQVTDKLISIGILEEVMLALDDISLNIEPQETPKFREKE